ncbi:hypothetical protein JGU66_23135 [Myxococcaceae bacterium JPH2]|nr:hypothetical protein [Myxococcaceae bacterium JPH2]
MTSYFILSADSAKPEYCQVWKYPSALSNFYKPTVGKPLGTEYPQGLSLQMAPEVPGSKIPDAIPNTLGYLLVSARMKELLASHATEPIEFLRFSLLTHKGRPASDDCYIANVVGTRPWGDMERSMGARVTSPSGEPQFDRLRRLYLKDAELDPKVNLFRLSMMPRVILVREDLKALMEAQGMQGTVFYPLGTKVDIQ